MALSTQRVVSDGSLTLLSLSIDYFDRADIAVLFDNVVRAPGNGWAWVGTTDKKISFTPAVPAGVEIKLKRTTVMSLPRHQYTQGAQFVAETLDENFKQVLYVAQETSEGGALTEVFNDLDMHGFRLRRIGQAIEDDEAVSLAQYKADAAGANQAKLAAQASQADALASKNAAKASEDAALASKNAAATSASNASTSEANALASKNAAATSASNAATSESNALTSKNSAATSLANFQNQYQGPKATAPTVRTDGSALQIGDLYFDTATGMRVYTAQGWASAGSSVNGTAKRGSIVATEGQTSFTIPGGYDPGFIDVYLDGAKLVNVDDVAVNSATAVVLTKGAKAGQTLDYVAYGTFSVANTYDQATIDAKVNSQQYRNRLMNGALLVDQRNASAEVTIASGVSYYVGDRWLGYTSIASRLNCSKPSITDLPGFGNCMLFYGVNHAATAAGDLAFAQQFVEGYMVHDSLWGSAQARPAALSFYAKAFVAGKYSGAIRNGDATRSFPFEFNLGAGVWTRVVVPVPGCTDGTWDKYTGRGMAVCFNLGSGSTYLSSSPHAWSTGNFSGTVGSVGVVNTATASLRLTGLQFEFGSAVTDFEFRPYPVEYQMCRRYCKVIAAGGVYNYVGFGSYETTNTFNMYVDISGMRTVPVPTLVGSLQTELAGNALSYTGSGLAGTDGMRMQFTIAGTTTAGLASNVRANNDANTKIILSAEL